jgi:hypothetical protein
MAAECTVVMLSLEQEKNSVYDKIVASGCACPARPGLALMVSTHSQDGMSVELNFAEGVGELGRKGCCNRIIGDPMLVVPGFRDSLLTKYSGLRPW